MADENENEEYGDEFEEEEAEGGKRWKSPKRHQNQRRLLPLSQSHPQRQTKRQTKRRGQWTTHLTSRESS